MRTSQKAALSLLISVILFGGFSVLAFTGLFDFIEARFFDPSVTASINRDISQNAEIIDAFLRDAQTRFSETLGNPSVRRSFLPNQSAEDIFERSRIYGLFTESLPGVQWIRFIDSGGVGIHFSTYNNDIYTQDQISVSYRNFSGSGIDYSRIAVGDGGTPKYIFDGDAERILFSFPFYDSYEVYRGTALFSLSARALSDYLINAGRLKTGEDITLMSTPAGILSGMGSDVQKALVFHVSNIWQEGLKNARLTTPNSNFTVALITVDTAQGFFVGRLVNEDQFTLPQVMKIILLVSFFLTVYLIIFLLFNIRQDPVTIVQNRMKSLQISLIEQFYENKEEMDWTRWSRELDLRREEINSQIKKGLKPASDAKSADIDVMIDKSWDEFLSVIESRRETGISGININEAKLEAILRRVLLSLPASSLSSGPAQPAAAEKPIPQASSVQTVNNDEEILEELEEAVEELEELEAIEEAEEPAVVPAEETAVDQLQKLASEIEFGSDQETDSSEEDPVNEELEIVSPFSSMLYDFSSSGDDTEAPDENGSAPDEENKKKILTNLEAVPDRKSVLADRQLFISTGSDKIENLEVIEKDPSTEETNGSGDVIGDVIEEHEGVHYISKNIINTGSETGEDIDRDFKELVDSVIK